MSGTTEQAPQPVGDEREAFNQWVEDYALKLEPNWSNATEADCFAAWQARAALAAQAPQLTNTKTHDHLSTMIGMFLGFKEKIGYKPGSVIDKAVTEAVEHLKDWPYPESALAAPQQAAPAECHHRPPCAECAALAKSRRPDEPAPQQAAPAADLEEVLRERDEAEDFSDVLLDEVLGHERPEWSSAYGRDHALSDVRERITALHKPAVDKAWDQFQSAMAAPQQAAPAVPTRQQILDSFGFLEGAVTETTYLRIVELVVKMLAAAQAPQQEVQSQAPAVPSQTFAPRLLAMVSNYADGHAWDKLDGYTCRGAAQEIAALRSMLAAAPKAPQQAAPAVLIARSLAEWHEDDGYVAWWAWNGREWAGEPAWIGSPNCDDWPGYHTHWTPHPAQPASAAEAVPQQEVQDEALRERDDAEDFIDALLDEVLGHERPEWSSAYGRDHALSDVRERIAALHKPAVDKAWDQFQSAMAAPQQEVQEPDGWLPVHSNRRGFYGGPLKTEDEAKQYISQVEQSNDSVTLIARPFTWADAPQPAPSGDALQLERERICAAIKAEDDYCVDQGDYMLDSDDCIKIVRGEWVRPDFAVDAARKEGK